MTTQCDGLVDDYLASYCEHDASVRLATIRRIWSSEGRLVDPPLEGQGHEGISGQAATLLSQFPNHVFERSTAVDFHHGFARFGWVLRAPSGGVVLEGTDFMTLSADGRIAQVVGFFGPTSPRP